MTEEQLTRGLIVEVKKLDIKPGSMVIIRVDKQYDPSIFAGSVEHLRSYYDFFVPFIIMLKDQNIEDVNEEIMNRLGWYRRPYAQNRVQAETAKAKGSRIVRAIKALMEELKK